MSEGRGHDAEVAMDLLPERLGDELDERVVMDGVAEQEKQLSPQGGGGAPRIVLCAGAVGDGEGHIEILTGKSREVLDEIACHGEREVPVLFDACAARAAVVIDDPAAKVLEQHLHMLEVVAIVCADGGCDEVSRGEHVSVIVERHDELVALLERRDQVMQNGGEVCFFAGQGQSLVEGQKLLELMRK